MCHMNMVYLELIRSELTAGQQSVSYEPQARCHVWNKAEWVWFIFHNHNVGLRSAPSSPYCPEYHERAVEQNLSLITVYSFSDSF